MFEGVSAYLETLLPRMTAVLLEKLGIVLFHQLTFAVPRLQQRISGLVVLSLFSMTMNLRWGYIPLRVPRSISCTWALLTGSYTGRYLLSRTMAHAHETILGRGVVKYRLGLLGGLRSGGHR
jgi:hypothetical protein